MSSAISEFFVSLKVSADTLKVKDFAKAIGDLPLSAAAAMAGLAGVGFGFTELTGKAIDMSIGLNTFTAETGRSSEALQRWEYVTKGVLGTGDAAKASFEGITKAMTRFHHYGDPSFGEGMNRLGIEEWEGKTPEQILEKVRQAYLRTPKNKRDYFGSALGLSGIREEMMSTFNVSDFQKRFNSAPIASQSDIEQVMALQKTLGKFSDELINKFLPVLVTSIPAMQFLGESLITAFGNVATIVDYFRHGKEVNKALEGFNNESTYAPWLNGSGMTNGKFIGAHPSVSSFSRSSVGTSTGTTGGVNAPTNVSMAIHTSADAMEVARLTAQEIARYQILPVMKEYGNQGAA